VTVEQKAERLNPAEWKHREVSQRIEAGTPLTATVREMQTTYVERQSETLVDGIFHKWLRD